MNKRYLSIDCGLNGGTCSWESLKPVLVESMPTIVNNGNKVLDMVAIKDKMQKHNVIVIEEQFSPHGKNQRGMKTNLVNYGMILGIALSLGVSNKGRSPLLPRLTKKHRAIKANRLYNLNLKQAEDGKADSVLVGHFFLLREELI